MCDFQSNFKFKDLKLAFNLSVPRSTLLVLLSIFRLFNILDTTFLSHDAFTHIYQSHLPISCIPAGIELGHAVGGGGRFWGGGGGQETMSSTPCIIEVFKSADACVCDTAAEAARFTGRTTRLQLARDFGGRLVTRRRFHLCTFQPRPDFSRSGEEEEKTPGAL